VLYANGFDPAAGATQYQGIWDQAGVGIDGVNVNVINAPNTRIGCNPTFTSGIT
jgi:hypothetical protein